MKYCQVCERQFSDDVLQCVDDGSALINTESREDSLVGQTINGKYRVVRKLGVGGMGTVYLAEQTSIGRKVALKVLQREFAGDKGFVKRFQQEARLAASLNHQHVVTVHDFDQAEDGSIFIAMEYVEGNNLRELIQEGPLSISQAVRLGRQTAEGLSAAHRLGIIHRDIKPENIMIVKRTGEVKLMDFGIAWLRGRENTTRLTQAGMIMGTPAYMAPEQIEGREVDERTDIYAFGSVLYEILSGNTPFTAPTPSALLVKHLTESPVPLKKARQEVPVNVEQLVMQMLEKNPERRQKSMDDITSELRRITETLSHEVPRTMAVPHPALHRKRRFVITGGLLTILIIVFLAIQTGSFLDPFRWSPRPTQVASLHVLAAKDELDVGESVPLRATARYSDGREQEIVQGLRWMSSNASVAEVGPDGKVEARNVGEANIIVRLDDVSAPGFNLTVRGPRNAPAQTAGQIVSLALQADTAQLNIKQRTTFKVKARFGDGTETVITKGVGWQSSDPSVLSINSAGDAEAQKQGKAIVTANYGRLNTEPFGILVRGAMVVDRPRQISQQATKQEQDTAPVQGKNDIVPMLPSLKDVGQTPFQPPDNAGNVVSEYINNENDRRDKGKYTPRTKN